MSTCLLKFAIDLCDHSQDSHHKHHGPLFHRWLPDGDKDAIDVDASDPDAKIRFWFERTGFVDSAWNNLIKFDYKRREVDSQLVKQQAVLDAGPMRGLLEIQRLDHELADVLRRNDRGDERFLKFGKRVIRLLVPQVMSFISVLRVNFGQYWIREPESWDSRLSSLGHYCKSVLHLKFSLDGSQDWQDFVPDDPIVYADLTVIVPSKNTFSQYLTQTDWKTISSLLNRGYEPTPAAVALARTHQLFDQGNIWEAFIEGVTALELAVHDYYREQMKTNDTLFGEMNSFWKLPLRSQLVSLAAAMGNIPLDKVSLAVSAIEIRNDIVHEGKRPTEKNNRELEGLLAAVAQMIHGPGFKLPSAKTGNNIAMEEEKWELLA